MAAAPALLPAVAPMARRRRRTEREDFRRRAAAPTPVVGGTRSPRVLIADDDVVIRQVLAVRLQGLGFAPQTASTGDRAYHLALHNPFDVLLLDVSMPGLTGVEVTQLVRRLAVPQPAILLISACVGGGDVGEVLEAGADGYLRKPFGVAELSARLDEVMAAHGG
ncbi:response regulator receiver domain-containing protein [Kineococcus xinjiangensis]|uniref:Response regulator receiver domain-containing protein n=1 Tax=Kineococcus xinjiangensis TaxID=512762 RepID=A0A2S6IWI5_9ACTN|nr:response regulator transcription factor [Kineococcus xinjiangensis]PPK98693.1 response regulator receiver domain-containing protein [Kineococcus xinjiangensis]